MENVNCFYDNTLRDGEQHPGVYFTKADKIKIVDILFNLGVSFINAGFPANGPGELKIISAMVKKFPHITFSALARCKKEDIDKASQCGVQYVSLFYPGSKILRSIKFPDQSIREAGETIRESVKYAKKNNLKVIMGLEDHFRASDDDIDFLYSIASSAGADYLGVVDTVGVATPDTVVEKIKKMKKFIKPLICHFHNDFGLATINSVTGLLNGADVVSTTITGVGERAGNASFEEVVMALEKLYKFKTNMNISKLLAYSKTIQNLTGICLDNMRPIVGDNIFAHESGIHVKAIKNNPDSYEPYNPKEVGQRRKIYLGKHSGLESVRSVLNTYNKEVSTENIQKVRKYIDVIISNSKNRGLINDLVIKYVSKM
jgi:isopropylmalate/homocitrate/citramalate synthase